MDKTNGFNNPLFWVETINYKTLKGKPMDKTNGFNNPLFWIQTINYTPEV